MTQCEANLWWVKSGAFFLQSHRHDRSYYHIIQEKYRYSSSSIRIVCQKLERFTFSHKYYVLVKKKSVLFFLHYNLCVSFCHQSILSYIFDIDCYSYGELTFLCPSKIIPYITSPHWRAELSKSQKLKLWEDSTLTVSQHLYKLQRLVLKAENVFWMMPHVCFYIIHDISLSTCILSNESNFFKNIIGRLNKLLFKEFILEECFLLMHPSKL